MPNVVDPTPAPTAAPLYPHTLAAHGPCRTLAEVRRDLLTRRLKLMLREVRSRGAGRAADAEWCEWEVAAVTRRLQLLDAETR